MILSDIKRLDGMRQRFWSHVAIKGNNDCWIWEGTVCSPGYGVISIATLSGHRPCKAHRISYLLAHGEVDDDLFVCHDCPDGDNPLCVNPSHLFLGTALDNALDRKAKGRGACGETHGSRTHPEKIRRGDQHPFRINPSLAPHGERNYVHTHPEIRQGERNGRAKLTETQVKEVRERHARGETYAELGRYYGIRPEMASFIVRRIAWKHIA